MKIPVSNQAPPEIQECTSFFKQPSPVIGRVVAGAVGCLAFYIALFLYKDERERWQTNLKTSGLK